MVLLFGIFGVFDYPWMICDPESGKDNNNGIVLSALFKKNSDLFRMHRLSCPKFVPSLLQFCRMNPYLHRLIIEGEHQYLDFKVEISDSRKIARSMVAFANAMGGRLLIGVKDGGGIAGVRSDEEIYMLKVAATKFCKPKIHFEVRKWQSGKKMVVEVIIPEGVQKPFYCLEEDERWQACIRVGDQNILVEKIVLKVWERQKQTAGTLVRYSHVEEMLIQYLEENPSINRDEFTRLAAVPPYIAEKVLVNLTCMKLLRMSIGEHGTFFSLQKEGFQE